MIQIWAVSQLWGILGIVIMILFSLKPKFFQRWRFTILYILELVVAANFVSMVYAPLTVFMVFRIASIILTYVFQAVCLSLMIDTIPKPILPPFYQVCSGFRRNPRRIGTSGNFTFIGCGIGGGIVGYCRVDAVEHINSGCVFKFTKVICRD